MLLVELSNQAGGGSLVSAWSKVLGVPVNDVVLQIGDVADLVRQIQHAADEVGERFVRAPVDRYRAEWARPIYPHDRAPQDTLSPVVPSDAAMEALESVSAHLHNLLPQGVVPGDDELDRLKEQLRTLIASVREADDLPVEVKQPIIARLLDVERAIEHVHMGGPDAVRLATEAVYGTLLRTATPQTATGRSVQSILALLAVLFAGFSQGDTIQKNLVAWPKVAHAITTGEVAQDDKAEAGADDGKKPAKADKPSPKGEGN